MPMLFLSYARPDQEVAVALADALREVGIDVWADFSNLAIGEDWEQAIGAGLRRADGIVVVASAQSSKSKWVIHEMEAALNSGTQIFPVVVNSFDFLPRRLQHIQAAKVSTSDLRWSVRGAAAQIQRTLNSVKPNSPLDDRFLEGLASELATEARSAGEQVSESAKHSVFVVHGRDLSALNEVKGYLASIGVDAVVLKEMEEQEISLLQRFLRVAEKADFAVVVLTPDDLGASVGQYESPKGGDKALQYRARQNVILELGFFLGKLRDFDRVFVVRKNADHEWPEFDMPSDLGGAIYKDLDSQGRWKELLKRALAKAGIHTR